MISKTIGCRGLAYFQTNPCVLHVRVDVFFQYVNMSPIGPWKSEVRAARCLAALLSFLDFDAQKLRVWGSPVVKHTVKVAGETTVRITCECHMMLLEMSVSIRGFYLYIVGLLSG